jgi:hypothetical protein
LIRVLRRTLLAATLIGATAAASSRDAPLAAPPLTKWRWHNRLLLVFAPTRDDPAYQAQRAALDAAAAGGAERDLVAISVLGTTADHGLDGAALRAAYRVPADRFAVLLIGKDGGEKLRAATPVSSERLFAVIDRMPMRRSETRGTP